MDDDVKNLFQKIGQATSSYQEINRDADSEQAKQRWPLLRDVRVYAQPDPVSHDNVQNTVSVTSSVLVKSTNEAAERKPLLKEFSGNPLFSRKKTTEGSFDESRSAGKEQIAPIAVSPLQQSALPEQSVFAQPVKKAAVNTPDTIKQETVRLNLFGNAGKSDSLPDTAGSSGYAPGIIQQNVQTNSVPDKAKAVADIFNRLARKPEAEKMPESPVNSFFKKIFRS